MVQGPPDLLPNLKAKSSPDDAKLCSLPHEHVLVAVNNNVQNPVRILV